MEGSSKIAIGTKNNLRNKYKKFLKSTWDSIFVLLEGNSYSPGTLIADQPTDQRPAAEELNYYENGYN
jgi:hypothetical protein